MNDRKSLPQVHYLTGASGTGKSTRARTLAREGTGEILVICTDVIRAQLRAVLARSAHPDLWAESFDVPLAAGDDISVINGVNVAGFLRQCAPIVAAVDAAVAYALLEGWNCIVEGVHLVPGMCAIPGPDEAAVTFELMVVPDEEQHRGLFVDREQSSAGGRPAVHYHDNLERIRTIQHLLLDRWEQWDSVAPDHIMRLVTPTLRDGSTRRYEGA